MMKMLKLHLNKLNYRSPIDTIGNIPYISPPLRFKKLQTMTSDQLKDLKARVAALRGYL